MPYEKLTRIGKRFLVLDTTEGNMGNIYFCFDLDINEMIPRVLKGLKSSYTRQVSNYQEMFRTEAVTWMNLGKHENIVQCIMTVEADGELYLLLEWIHNEYPFGVDLRHWIQHRAIELKDALQFFAGICDGLIYANQQIPGLVHRDLKPENILIGPKRTPLITDFGLANLLRNANLSTADDPKSMHDTMIKGRIVGTPPYMAPEQWQIPNVDHRVDIYALGCILYEMITGEMAFGDIDRLKVRQLHETGALPTLPFVPQPINELIQKCLAKRPEDRFQTFEEIKSRILDIQELTAYSINTQPFRSTAEQQANNYGNKALSYANLGQYDLAFEYWDKAFRLNPRLARGYNNRGTAYQALGRFEEAIRDFNSALEVKYDFVEALINRGAAYSELHNFDRALEDLDRALTLQPDFIEGIVNRSNLYNQMGDFTNALKDADRALKLDPQCVIALHLKAMIHIGMNDIKQAITDLDQAIKIDHNNSELLELRGTAKLSIGDTDGVNDFIQSHDLNPDRPVSLNTVKSLVSFAEHNLEQGLLKEVIDYFGFIEVSFGKNGSTSIYMGELLEKYGFIPEALTRYIVAKSLGDETANDYITTALHKLYEMPEEQLAQRMEIANSYRKWHPDPDEFLQQSLQKLVLEQDITLDDLDEGIRKALSIHNLKRAREVAIRFPFIKSPQFQEILEEMRAAAPQDLGNFIILVKQFLRDAFNDEEQPAL